MSWNTEGPLITNIWLAYQHTHCADRGKTREGIPRLLEQVISVHNAPHREHVKIPYGGCWKIHRTVERLGRETVGRGTCRRDIAPSC